MKIIANTDADKERYTQVDAKAVAAFTGVPTKKVRPCSAEAATAATGYEFGGTTPIG